MAATPAIRQKRGEVQHFKPNDAGVREAALKAAAETAKRMRDWESFWTAVDELIRWEREIVTWWDGNIARPGPRNKSPNGDYFSVKQAEQKLKVSDGQVSRWRKWLADEKKYRARLGSRGYRAGGIEAEANHGALGTGENEWYTPIQYIEAAREVMGGIDLDPATSEVAQKAIQAAAHFTLQQDGLKQAWQGRVWLNPPYTQPAIHHFIEKLLTEATEGRVEQAIVLTHNSTDTLWFHRLEEVASRICFTKGRIAFIDSDGDPCAPTQGQAFFYCGENGDRFAEVFKRFGFVR